MDKKGQWQLLFLSPWVLLGVAIFIILLLVGVYLSVWTWIGIVLVILGAAMIFRGGNPWWGLTLIVIGALMIWNPIGRFGLQLFGVGTDYTLQTEEYQVTFHTDSEYFVSTGCESACESVDHNCNVQSEVIGTVAGCNIYHCYSTGAWRECTSYKDRCQYGGNCNPSDSTCNRYCDWKQYDYGTRGGPNYDSMDNCAWWVEVKDKNGNLIKEFSQRADVSGWDSDKPFYRSGIDYDQNGLVVKTNGENYGSNSNGNPECLQVFFRVEDFRYRYDVCVGNDAQENCKDVLTKTCKLQCPDNVNYELDMDNCVCLEKTCSSNSDCGDNQICQDTKCVAQPEITSWWDRVMAWLNGIFAQIGAWFGSIFANFKII